jgi:cobalamin biosynthesis protein CobT
MPRPNNLSALFNRKSERPSFTPEVLTALDESNGYETYQDESGNVCVKIITLDGQNTIEVPNEQLEGLLHITRVALSANVPKRTRRSKEEIEAASNYGIPAAQNPVSNNVMVNLMGDQNEPDADEEDGTEDKTEPEISDDSKTSDEPELVAAGTRTRRR